MQFVCLCTAGAKTVHCKAYASRRRTLANGFEQIARSLSFGGISQIDLALLAIFGLRYDERQRAYR